MFHGPLQRMVHTENTREDTVSVEEQGGGSLLVVFGGGVGVHAETEQAARAQTSTPRGSARGNSVLA